MRARFVIVVIASVVIGSGWPTGGARADQARMKPEARVHLERGLKLYQRQKYDEAIDELREGLAIDPQPDLLYALGQTERKRGNCERAIEYYQSCLALVKDAAAAAALRVQIERCRVEKGESGAAATSATEAAATPVVPQAPAAEPSTTTPTPTPSTTTTTTTTPSTPTAAGAATGTATRRWYRDPLGATTLAVGIAGVAAGGVLVGIAEARAGDATASYQQFVDARGAPVLWTAGIVTLAVGGALVATGIIRFSVLGARRARSGGS